MKMQKNDAGKSSGRRPAGATPPTGFHTEIIRRTVMVSCHDNDHGGVHLPPGDGDDHAWRHAAMTAHPEIDGIEGPTISGAYVFHWLGTLRDGQIKFRSEKIIKELYR